MIAGQGMKRVKTRSERSDQVNERLGCTTAETGEMVLSCLRRRTRRGKRVRPNEWRTRRKGEVLTN
jgi:hypothetical protein